VSIFSPSSDKSPNGAAAPIILGMQLTLLDLLLQPVGPWWLRWAILLLAAAGLIARGAITHPGLWLALGALTSIRVVADWPLSDNHAYLLSYWCLACGLAALSPRRDFYLARNARWLIGLSFALATLWKLALSADYGSGLFFRVTLLTDPRFENFARLAGGLSLEQFNALRDHVSAHADNGMAAGLAAPAEPLRFKLLAQGASIWNMALNFSIAMAFLWPEGRGPSRIRNELLLVFCLVTYAIATVEGFGWLLIAMATTQTSPGQRHTRAAYVIVFGLILLYREIPWGDLIFTTLTGDR